jgi:hypothetical protein
MQRMRARLNSTVEVSDDNSPPHLVHTWAWAPAYEAGGYNATPILFADIASGRESPPGSPWMAKTAEYVVPPAQAEVTGIAINCGGWDLVPGMLAPPTVAALRVDIAQDHALAAHLVDSIVKPRLRWADSAQQLLPVRSTVGSAALLIPLRLDTHLRFGSLETARYSLPKDKHPTNKYLRGPVNRVSLKSWGECFVASGQQFRWTCGGLPAVARAQLPSVSVDDARQLIRDIEAVLDTRGTALKYKITNVC